MSNTPKDELIDDNTAADGPVMEGESNASDSRRKAVRNILAGSGLALGAASTDSWVAPVVNSVVAPAHAQTSAPIVLAGNASLTPAAPRGVANSVLDFLVPAAHAGAAPVGMNFGGACIIITFSSPTAFSLSVQLTTGPAMIIAGTASGSMLSASGSGIVFSATANFSATPATASGTLVSGNATFDFTLSSDNTTCTPIDPGTTAPPGPTTVPPTTVAPTTMVPTTIAPTTPPLPTTIAPTTPPLPTTMAPTTPPLPTTGPPPMPS